MLQRKGGNAGRKGKARSSAARRSAFGNRRCGSTGVSEFVESRLLSPSTDLNTLKCLQKQQRKPRARCKFSAPSLAMPSYVLITLAKPRTRYPGCIPSHQLRRLDQFCQCCVGFVKMSSMDGEASKVAVFPALKIRTGKRYRPIVGNIPPSIRVSNMH